MAQGTAWAGCLIPHHMCSSDRKEMGPPACPTPQHNPGTCLVHSPPRPSLSAPLPRLVWVEIPPKHIPGMVTSVTVSEGTHISPQNQHTPCPESGPRLGLSFCLEPAKLQQSPLAEWTEDIHRPSNDTELRAVGCTN